MPLFEDALQELRLSTQGVTSPRSFREYAHLAGVPAAQTAPSISVDAISRLANELRNGGAMVFRLGQGRFALARSTRDDLSDYFILDGAVWADVREEVFVPRVSVQTLFAYHLLPTLTESSAVNLAVASGLMGHALGLDEAQQPVAPATAQSSFTFSFRAHKGVDPWEHRSGQVQIDAVITGARAGKTTLFVIEAKLGASDMSLAKHKLVYPVLSVAPKVPPSMPIVPIYLRAEPGRQGLSFYFTECEFPDYAMDPALARLEPVRRTRFLLPGYGQTS